MLRVNSTRPARSKFTRGSCKVSSSDLPSVNEGRTGRKVWSLMPAAVSASPPLPTSFDFTTKCGKIYTFASMHISSSPFLPPFSSRIFPGVGTKDRRIEVGNKREGKWGGRRERSRWAHHNVSFHRWSDRWVTEFYAGSGFTWWCVEVNRWSGPPSGGIHSCTFERHNSRTGGISRIPGRYGIIY